MQRGARLIAGLVGGGILGILARVVLRMVYDTAANGARLDVSVLVVGTLVVAVAFLVAAAVSVSVAAGAALASTGSIVASWLGLRLSEAQPAVGSESGYMV